MRVTYGEILNTYRTIVTSSVKLLFFNKVWIRKESLQVNLVDSARE